MSPGAFVRLTLGLTTGAGLVWWLARQSGSNSKPPAPPSGSSPAQPRRLAARRARLLPLLRNAAQRYQLPLAWLLAITHQETGFRNLRSRPGASDDRLGGAWGPMQVTSATARTLGFWPSASSETRGQAIIAKPALGIELGARYLARLVTRFGLDLARLAAAYNAGPGAVRRGRIPRRTRERYVPAVIALAQRYEQAA